jgi:carbonic anhydrase
MQKLLQGLHKFRETVFRDRRDLFEQLATGQRPEALFITCSDSRVNPNLLTQTQPGDLFILRNAGALVPAFGANAGGEEATIEYAVGVLGVKDIIVCGHSHCGAMQALLEPEKLDGLPSVARWLGHAEATRRLIKENYRHLSGKDLVDATIQENVLVQIENLRTHPAVRSALSRRELNLHGWVYRIETGDVVSYNPDSGKFAVIEREAA